MEEYKFPKNNWYIECNIEDNSEEILNEWFHENCKDYKNYANTWLIDTEYGMCYFYPQNHHNGWATQSAYLPNYKEITFNQFKQYVLKSKSPKDYNYLLPLLKKLCIK